MAVQALHFTISEQVFQKYPGYLRGVVVGRDVKNGASPQALISLLREAEAYLRQTLDAESIPSHPQIAAWREAYRAFGAKPSEFRSSVEAMARRVVRNNELPSINALVDIGNIVSLRHLVPVGGHAMEDMRTDIELRPANGDENFVAFGSTELEHPEPGEIIFVEDHTVLTRRWTWRQAQHTLILPGSAQVEINVDGLGPAGEQEVARICDEVQRLVEEFCGGTCRVELVTEQQPRMRIYP